MKPRLAFPLICSNDIALGLGKVQLLAYYTPNQPLIPAETPWCWGLRAMHACILAVVCDL
jgi:hypothetical protein